MGPSPQELLAASLASCTAVTMEMYAGAQGLDVDGMRSTAATRRPSAAARPASSWSCGCAHLSEEQVERLQVIAAKCPVTAPSRARSP